MKIWRGLAGRGGRGTKLMDEKYRYSQRPARKGTEPGSYDGFYKREN